MSSVIVEVIRKLLAKFKGKRKIGSLEETKSLLNSSDVTDKDTVRSRDVSPILASAPIVTVLQGDDTLDSEKGWNDTMESMPTADLTDKGEEAVECEEVASEKSADFCKEDVIPTSSKVLTENLPEEKEEEDVEELWWDDGNYDICDSTSSGVDARYSPVDFLSPSITAGVADTDENELWWDTGNYDDLAPEMGTYRHSRLPSLASARPEPSSEKVIKKNTEEKCDRRRSLAVVDDADVTFGHLHELLVAERAQRIERLCAPHPEYYQTAWIDEESK